MKRNTEHTKQPIINGRLMKIILSDRRILTTYVVDLGDTLRVRNLITGELETINKFDIIQGA